jgi:UDP-N-acetyl-D-mannosaminuronate dehydrogenase
MSDIKPRFDRIAVLGLGKVGHLAAELLADSRFEVLGVDARPVQAPLSALSSEQRRQLRGA